ncbi:MAG TPA: DUF3313 domain-containing protein [Candidatus Binatia bacterium]|nr:DUF3313 domain-containing protein [Candidatus Binatia bacterium]
MRFTRSALVVASLVVALSVVACAKRVTPVLNAAEMSGFLDDYSRLVPGGPDQPTFVYHDRRATLAAYDRILFEPVTIWRSGKQSLADIPPEDLERLAFELQRAVRTRLERSFRLVDQPGPGVLRIRLGLTQARQDDPVLDVFTYAVPPTAAFSGDEPLAPATRTFVDAAALEGELSDAASGAVVAMGVDRRRAHQLQTWADVRAAADRWAAWFEGRLERARTSS